MKPFSAACEQNQAPILAVLKDALADAARVLEIGSGTGQHACYFPARLTHLHWQPSDVADNLPGIRAWLSQARLANVAAPLALDVNDAWPSLTVDAVFTANTTHIMSWRTNLAMLRGVARRLPDGGRFVIYGPFNYNGAYTADSNRRFDAWLKRRDPDSGIRDVEAIQDELAARRMALINDHAMPANNRLLVFRKC